MNANQFYGWSVRSYEASRDDAAVLNESTTPRKETWLSRRMKELKDETKEPPCLDR